jgi:hypothetical protein
MTDLVLPPLKTDTAEDTLPLSASVEVTPSPAAVCWQFATLSDLSEVEDMLDSLEAHGIVEREVVALDNNLFAVRWR